MKSPIKSFVILFVTMFAVYCYQMVVCASPHNGEVYWLKQPDNSCVNVKVFGDEFYQRVESIDGYTLVRDPDTDWICYAKLNEDMSEFISTGIKYSASENSNNQINIKSKLKKSERLNRKSIEKKADEVKKILLSPDSYQQSGISIYSESSLTSGDLTAESNSLLGLTILVKFSDQDTDITKQNVDDMLNKVGYDEYGNNGSVRDYFYDVSGGAVIYNNQVTDFYVAKKPKTYYDDSSSKFGLRAAELVTEALQDLEKKGFDFSKLSINSNKTVLAVNVLYAGSADLGWGKGLWSHFGYLNKDFYADGVKVSTYQIEPLKSSLNISTFVHENGHMLFGWPDLYDYDSESTGAGKYSIMSYSEKGNPVPPDPYLRSIFCDWGKVITLNDLPDKTIVSVKAGSLEVYKFEGPNPKEYYLIENIAKKGRWKNIPDEGLIIWHIDENGSNDYQEMTYQKHYMVSVEQADGKFHLEKNANYGDKTDLFDGVNYFAFNDTTIPSSKWWNGQNSGLSISNISTVGDVMTFVVNNSNYPKVTPTITPRNTTMPSSTPTLIKNPTSTVSPTNTPKLQLTLGDANGDNLVNSLDFAYLRMYLLGMLSDFSSKNGKIAVDVNGDNSINSIDFAYLRMYLLGQIDKFPAEN